MRIALASAIVGAGSMICQQVLAQSEYPTKPIRIIVPFTPGGINDFAARSVSVGLNKALNVSVVVDNVPGAGGIIGTKLAAKASPDGYTVIVGSVATHAIKQSLYKNPPYDVIRDFVAVTLIAETPLVVVVHPSLPVKSVKELVALCKLYPKHLSYASSGVGTATHLAAELFAKMAKVQLVHVPYKSAGPAVIDLIGGHITLMFATTPSVLPHAKSGKLHALAVTGAKRSPSAPDLPTVAEAGVPRYEVRSWSGMFAPAGTPKGAVNRLAEEVNRILRTPASKEYFFSQGAEAVGGTPEEFAGYVKTEIAKWKNVVEFSGASAN